MGKIKEKTLFKLFDGYNFPYLADFTIKFVHVKRLTREFINRLAIIRQLIITQCEIEIIELDDLFSNMQLLTSLNFSGNLIKLIEENAFSKLNNLETLDLSSNRLTKFDRNFISLENSVEVNIEYNDSIDDF